VDEKILDFFPEIEGIAHMDERKASIRLKDLLTMRNRIDYHERRQDSPHFRLNRTPTGWDKFYLDRPMAGDPGKNFNYDSGGLALRTRDMARFGLLYLNKGKWEGEQVVPEKWFRDCFFLIQRRSLSET
jgi:CubicO group peptidase (beta-lactamase class C family)